MVELDRDSCRRPMATSGDAEVVGRRAVVDAGAAVQLAGRQLAPDRACRTWRTATGRYVLRMPAIVKSTDCGSSSATWMSRFFSSASFTASSRVSSRVPPRLASDGRLIPAGGRLLRVLHRVVVRTHGVADNALRTRGVLRIRGLGVKSGGGGGHTKHRDEANNLPHIPFRTNGRVSAADFPDAVGWNLCAAHGPTARAAP